DPVAGRAISAIHANPGEDWSVPRLASEVSMSPSRFSARFTASLGDSPMAYVAKWRMNVACRKLAASRMPIEQIAAEVGYESHAAFNRAFKKFVGASPSAWRSRVST
ncbi:MAG: AraC family transcriptional regulator, partial [Betaproteobacteria bacterium]